MPSKITELRSVLDQTLRLLARQGGASNEDIISIVRREHGALIRASHRELENIALKRVLNDLAAKRYKIEIDRTSDLFGDAPALGRLVSMKVDGDLKRVDRDEVKLGVLIRKYEALINRKGENKKDENILGFLRELAKNAGTEDVSFGEAVKLTSK